jgi:trk system potassium uptake protein TrkA
MRTIIVGCGRVGAGLANRLATDGDELIVIDLRSDAFDRLDEGFSGQAIRGDGTDEEVLRRAGAQGADRFFALTEGDNRNVLASQLAAEAFEIPTVVAKINDPIRAETYARLGIATACRTEMMVDAMAAYVGLPSDPTATRVRAPSGQHPGPHPVLRPVATTVTTPEVLRIGEGR